VAALAGALDALAKHAVRHFADEEAYMARIKFPELDRHKRIHTELVAKVSAYATTFEASGQLIQEYFDFLTVWLKAHICGIDARYGKHHQAAA
jgi:hemerythrin-like metal-binding protein